MGSSQSTQVPPQLSARLTTSGIPTVLQFKFKKSWTDLTVLINEPDAPPSLCLTLPDGWYGAMSLRDGPLEAGPPIAHSTFKGKMQLENSIALPPPATSDAWAGNEILRYKWGKRDKYWFAMDVGDGANRVEKFEWRRSRGKEVKGVGQGSTGWKLVRLASGVQVEGGKDEDEDEELGGKGDEEGEELEYEEAASAGAVTSDGKEVVAVWANASFRKMSMTNIGELRLCGSGATTEFGVRWGVMAVMSCMAVWQREMAAAMAASG